VNANVCVCVCVCVRARVCVIMTITNVRNENVRRTQTQLCKNDQKDLLELALRVVHLLDNADHAIPVRREVGVGAASTVRSGAMLARNAWVPV
jgi:hypothetical protein